MYFWSAREEAAPSVCFVVDRRAPSRHRGSARHAAGTGTDRDARAAELVALMGCVQRLRGWKMCSRVAVETNFLVALRCCRGWAAACAGPETGLVELSLTPERRHKQVVLQACAAGMILDGQAWTGRGRRRLVEPRSPRCVLRSVAGARELGGRHGYLDRTRALPALQSLVCTGAASAVRIL
jgi:hypothetical protein